MKMHYKLLAIIKVRVFSLPFLFALFSVNLQMFS